VKYSVDSRLGDLLKDPAVAAVLQKHFPMAANDPRIGMVKGLTLRQIAAMPIAGVKPEVLEALDKDLQLIP
jgi:hypothetical protein